MKNRFFVVALLLAGILVGFAACGGDDPPAAPPPSSAKAIVSFTAYGQSWNVSGTPIKPNAAYAEKEQNVAALVATVQVSPGATITAPAGATGTAPNFTVTLNLSGQTGTITVQAEDGSSQSYTVTATP